MKNSTATFAVGTTFVLVVTIILSFFYPGPGDYNFFIALGISIVLFFLSTLVVQTFVPEKYREKVLNGVKKFFDAVFRNI